MVNDLCHSKNYADVIHKTMDFGILLATIMVDHFPLFAQINSQASCRIALVPPQRHQHPGAFTFNL